MSAVIEYRYTGGSANSNPNASLGGVGSSVQLLTTALNTLFDSIPNTDVVLGNNVEYRAFDIYNSGDATALHVQFFLTDTPNSDTAIAVWFDSVGTQSVADELTEPAGASWTAPDNVTKMDLANIPAGGSHRIWIRRTALQNSSEINDDTGTLHTWHN